MKTRFSKQKLAEPQEKKAKGGNVSGLLSKKKAGDVSKKDPVTTLPPTHSPAKRPAPLTSSLEMIAFGGEEIRKKKKAGGKSFFSTFEDDVDATALKAHKALFVDDLSPLMAKSSSEVMLSHIQKFVQVCAVSRLYFFFFLYFTSAKRKFLCKLWGSPYSSRGSSWIQKNKVATSEPLIKSLSAENETLKNKVAILTTEVKNDKERVATLEKSLQVEKDFCKLKDKQICNLELKLQNIGATTVQDFKDSDEYSDELCKYYMEGFDLFVKWMAKHHPGLDLSSFIVDNVEKELMSNCPSEATAENVTEEATNVVEGMKKATVITPCTPCP